MPQLLSELTSYRPDAASGTAEVFLSGTSNYATVYGNAGGSTTIANPVVLSSTGIAVAYVDAAVDVTVKSSAGVALVSFTTRTSAHMVEVKSVSFTGTLANGQQGAGGAVDLDTVEDRWLASAGAKDWKVRRSGSTADETIVAALAAVQAASLPIYNVMNYGAVLDGATDDYAAWKAAYDAAVASNGGIIFIPSRPGATYGYGTTGAMKVSQTLAISSSRISMMGEGAGSCIYGTFAGPIVNFATGGSGSGPNATGQMLSNLRILGPQSACIAVQNTSTPGLILDGLVIMGCYGSAALAGAASGNMYFQVKTALRNSIIELSTGAVTGCGVVLNAAHGTTITDVDFTATGTGLSTCINNYRSRPIMVKGCRFGMSATQAIQYGVYNQDGGGANITETSVIGCSLGSAIANATVMHGDGGYASDLWTESGNTILDGTVASAMFLQGNTNPTGQIAGSRVGRWKEYTSAGGSAVTLDGQYERHVITANANFTLNSSIKCWGGKIFLTIKNTSGGAITVTYATGTGIGWNTPAGTQNVGAGKYGALLFQMGSPNFGPNWQQVATYLEV